MEDSVDRAAILQEALEVQRALEAGVPEATERAADLLRRLRDVREYQAAAGIAELLSRIAPDDLTSRRIYAQALIETEKPTAAIDMLSALKARVPADHPEAAEASGLIGRAWKDIFLAAPDRKGALAVAALKESYRAYRVPYLRDPANTWHAVNLLALSAKAAHLGIVLDDDIDRVAVAQQILALLDAVPEEKRDAWHWATVAEASIALGDWDRVVAAIRTYAAEAGNQFQLASTIRQFSRLWGLDDDPDGAQIVAAVKARLLSQPGGLVESSIAAVRAEAATAMTDAPQDAGAPSYGTKTSFEAVMGDAGPETFRWWQQGLKTARSVASVRQRMGGRVGTAWLAAASTFGLGGKDDQVVVTNFHVVNPDGVSPGIRPEDAEIVFEAISADAVFHVDSILWHSDMDRHDVSILKLVERVPDADPLPPAPRLPALDGSGRVYVVGYPGGRDLAFSFQDNQLLDHEGPTKGKPQIPGVCRIHYLAPTEGGSSGSPVFNAQFWEVIGVHHRGGKIGMPKLNGQPGSYGANEAISIASIAAAIAQPAAPAPAAPAPAAPPAAGPA